jgi:TfoX/Sxy family transcriptional regulator of competence genes
MDWPKSPDSLIQTFSEVLPEVPTIERRKMFGYHAAFVGGNLFASLHGSDLVLRLPDDARAALLTQSGARVFEPMAGRPMREYVVLPPTIVADRPILREWVDRAFQHAAGLAPKEPKPAKKKASSKSIVTG